MALTLDGTNGIVSSGSITTQSATGVIFSDSSSLPAASSPYVLKNRIINGDMRINQRNLGTVNPTSGDTLKYTIDRFWVYNSNAASKFSVQQSSTAPAGFVNSALITVTNAYTPTGGDEFEIGQYIEGLNISDLAWGTADAKTVTLSFWVRSSVTGTFGGSLVNSGYNRSYPFSYTISSANTWEQKSITITGDTSGTWLTTNGVGIRLQFSLGVGSTKTTTANAWTAGEYYNATGSVNLVATAGATFYITGVQLEIGTTATPFERRLYGTELALCERYYQILGTDNSALGFASYMDAGVTAYTTYTYHTVMRATPSGVYNMQPPTNATVSFTLGSDSIRHVLMAGSTGRTASAGDTNAIRLSAEL
jgi:hypothetical protein